MPIYEFECEVCGVRFEELVREPHAEHGLSRLRFGADSQVDLAGLAARGGSRAGPRCDRTNRGGGSGKRRGGSGSPSGKRSERRGRA